MLKAQQASCQGTELFYGDSPLAEAPVSAADRGGAGYVKGGGYGNGEPKQPWRRVTP